MLRSLVEFAFVLTTILTLLPLPSDQFHLRGLLSRETTFASFGHYCTDDSVCYAPLICSNASQCVCSTWPSASFWTSTNNTCLACPAGWTEWQQKKCLLLRPTSDEHRVSHEKATNSCREHASQLLQINDHDDLVQWQHASANDESLIDGLWIDFHDRE